MQHRHHRYSVHIFQYLYRMRKNPTRYAFVTVTMYTRTRNKADQYFGTVLRGLSNLFQVNRWITHLHWPQPLPSKFKHSYESRVTICQTYSFPQQTEKLHRSHFCECCTYSGVLTHFFLLSVVLCNTSGGTDVKIIAKLQ